MDARTISDLEPHRTALTGLCYRMLGSIVDAEDAVQETLVRAWRARDQFDGRSSVRTWLHRIATNACLDAIDERKRRVRAFDERPVGTPDDELETRPRTHWLEPGPDARLIPDDADPAEKTMLRESVRLAFVAALQHLPPRQRAALLLTEVVGMSAAEVAATLETSVASVDSALQRARATLAERRGIDALGGADVAPAQVDAYLRAFEAYDMDALATLLRDDVVLSMPPHSLWLQGWRDVEAWFRGRGKGCSGSRMIPVRASGGVAFAQYKPTHDGTPGVRAWSLNTIEAGGADGKIARLTFFLDVETLFPRFGLPLVAPA